MLSKSVRSLNRGFIEQIGLNKFTRLSSSASAFTSTKPADRRLELSLNSFTKIQRRNMAVNQAIVNKFQLPARFQNVPARPW